MAKTFRVLPHMCKQQKEEIDAIMHAADDIGAAAVSVASNSGQGYGLLLEARDRFKHILLSSSSRYRICIEEEEDSYYNTGSYTKYAESVPSYHIDDSIE